MALMLMVLVVILLLLSVKPLMKCARIIYFARRLPGPKTIPLLGNIMDALMPMEEFMEHFYKICLNYKFSTFWLGPLPVVVVYNPQHLKVILGDSKQITKPFWYQFTIIGQGLVSIEDKAWKVHRKIIEPAFDVSMLGKYTEVFCSKGEKLVKILEKHAGAGQFDIHDYILKCTLDIILETALGTESNCLEMGGEEEYVERSGHAGADSFYRCLRPWLYPDFIFNNTQKGRDFKRYRELLVTKAENVIREMKEMPVLTTETETGRRKKASFLELIIDANRNQGKLTHQDVVEEFLTFITAGHKTTAYTVNWMMQLLGTNPAVQEKVHEELDSIFRGSDRPPTMEDISDMKYLERVVKETLRLYAVIPMFLRVLDRDIELDGHKLPAGAYVVICPYFVHRNPDVYPNPEQVDPDNFLPEREASRSSYSWIPFSAGPRKCIGYKYAMLEVKILASYILRNYQVRAALKTLTPVPHLSLSSQEGFPMYLTRRRHVSSQENR